jgi:hypothetical protein
MEDNFEKEAKKYGDAYQVQPREWVWPRVEAELDKKKERRIAAWWWMVPVGLLMLGAGIWLIGSNKTANNSTSSTVAIADETKKSTKEESTTELEQDESFSSPNANAIVPPIAKEKNTANPTVVVKHNQIENTDASATEIGISRTTGYRRNATKPAIPKGSNADDKELTEKREIAGSTDKPSGSGVRNTDQTLEKSGLLEQSSVNQLDKIKTGDLTIEKQTEEKADVQTSSIVNDPINNAAQKNTDSAEVNKQDLRESNIALTKITANKTSLWSVNVGVGVANNSNGLGFSQLLKVDRPLYLDYQSDNSGGPCTSCNSVRGPLISNGVGLSLGLSVERSQWLSNRWWWRASLGWQYQQMQQQNGGRKDSAVNYSSLYNLNYSYFYQSGTSITVSGTNHRIIVSNQIVFAALKNKRLRLSGGLYGGWNISNHYLIPDRTNLRFVDGKGLYKKGFLGGEAGIRYLFKNNWFVGLNGRVDFTKSYIPTDGKKQYWKSGQLQAGIPISTINKMFKHK